MSQLATGTRTYSVTNYPRIIFTQTVKEFKDFKRSNIGYVLITAWIVISLFTIQNSFSKVDSIELLKYSDYFFWQNNVFYMLIFFILPSFSISAERESGILSLNRASSVNQTGVVLGKLLFYFLLLLSLFSISTVFTVVYLYLIKVEGFSFYTSTLILLSNQFIELWIGLSTISFAMMISSFARKKVTSVVANILIALALLSISSNLLTYYDGSVIGSPVLSGIPFYAYLILLLNPQNLTGILAQHMGILTHLVTVGNATLTYGVPITDPS